MYAGTGTGNLRSKNTRLVQRTVQNLQDANREFMDSGHDGTEVCVVVVPDNRVCCWNCILQVPSGPNILWSSFGANQGKLMPGMKLCWPVWREVSAMISKQVITYNATPKRCPTRDNVFVNADLSINIRIKSEITEVQNFFFKMGPARLDAYLDFEVEECIRSLVNSVPYDKVNDLRSDFSTEMLRTLQGKVSPFGVEVLNVKITDVFLPRELQERLEKTTAFATRIAEEEKNHNYAVQQLTNVHAQSMAAIKQKVNIETQQLEAERARYEVSQDEKMAVAKSDRQVRSENAKGILGVAVTKARGEVEVAQYEGRAEADKVVLTMNIKCEEELRKAKLLAATEHRAADAHKNASTYLADARLTEAKAAGEAAAQREEMVRHEHRLRLAEIDAQLAGKGRKFLSGEAGKGIIESFVMVRGEL
mmetsp:Transcript_15949/g.37016  ORF Transcript_15949/g.37016 Transcript_15949/m.37016 type:complete len:421 (-) Transcript_15949:28-1290(-)|eukprot:CAMPEP_0172593706 /NCGR_PEP_ID=MMETSP1068-20121228/12940_1 /TAXON_ID=35684 /ORGANISM="Pseudopedinella elastica, Strain CCMP716" /LENGTH=420 /DNA_ID=CAMNT_0013391353 /DNA_START=176 /DNA_END=1438 /DNA_ORIENTATION=-